MKKIGTKDERNKIKKLIEEADALGFKKGTFYIRTRKLEDGSIITHEEVADHRAEYFCTYDDDRGITLTCGPSQGLIYIRGKFDVAIDKKRSVCFY